LANARQAMGRQRCVLPPEPGRDGVPLRDLSVGATEIVFVDRPANLTVPPKFTASCEASATFSGKSVSVSVHEQSSLCEEPMSKRGTCLGRACESKVTEILSLQ